jgi:hypothetical protein
VPAVTADLALLAPAAPRPFWAKDPAAEEAAGAGTAAPTAGPEDELPEDELPEDELEALPEQPATAAVTTRMRQGTAAAPIRRRRP